MRQFLHYLKFVALRRLKNAAPNPTVTIKHILSSSLLQALLSGGNFLSVTPDGENHVFQARHPHPMVCANHLRVIRSRSPGRPPQPPTPQHDPTATTRAGEARKVSPPRQG